MSEVQDYNAGLAKGTAMTDAEVLRFHNGMVACLQNGTGQFRLQDDPKAARQNLGTLMDLLAERNIVATVGFLGTPNFGPLQ